MPALAVVFRFGRASFLLGACKRRAAASGEGWAIITPCRVANAHIPGTVAFAYARPCVAGPELVWTVLEYFATRNTIHSLPCHGCQFHQYDVLTSTCDKTNQTKTTRVVHQDLIDHRSLSTLFSMSLTRWLSSPPPRYFHAYGGWHPSAKAAQRPWAMSPRRPPARFARFSG
jgi:hypothetical protein